MKYVLVFLIFLGLFFLFFFSPAITYLEFSECTGTASLSGEFIKIFYSQSQNKIGVLISQNKTFLTVLNNFELTKNKEYRIYGKFSELKNQCWVFPDKVVEID